MTHPRNNDVCEACGLWVSAHQAQHRQGRTLHRPELDCTVNPITEHPLAMARALLGHGTVERLPPPVVLPRIHAVIEATRKGASVLLERVTTTYPDGESAQHWEIITLGQSANLYTDRARAWTDFARWPRTGREPT